MRAPTPVFAVLGLQAKYKAEKVVRRKAVVPHILFETHNYFPRLSLFVYINKIELTIFLNKKRKMYKEEK